MPIGPGWREVEVALTAEPFNLQSRETAVLCEPRDPYSEAIIRITLYRLR